MKKIRLVLIATAIFALGSAFTTKLHKQCTPAWYKDGTGFHRVGPHTCPSSTDVCTYEEDQVTPCEDNGTYTPN